MALMLVEAAVELSYPVLLACLVDRGIVAGDPVQVLLWGGLMLALALLSFACGISSTFFASDAGQSVARDLRASIFDRVIAAPVRGVQRFTGASLLTRSTGDVNQIQIAVFMCLRLYLRAPLIIAGAVALAMLVDPWLALPLLLATPFVALALQRTMAHGLRLFLVAQERLDRVTGLLGENLRGLWPIRAFGRRRDELRRFAEANDRLADASAAALRLSEMVVPSLILLLNLCVVAVLWHGAERIQAQASRPGDVVAVLNYAARIVGEFFYLPLILTNLGRARSALRRVGEVLALQPEERPPSPAERAGPRLERPPAVAFDAVTVCYPGRRAPTLGPLRAAVPAGRMLAVVGATGSGKSTLLQLLPRLFDADGGRILLDGRDLRDWPLAALREGIGYVPQSAPLASGTVREALLWGGIEAGEAELVAATRAARIHEQILAWPQGYETPLAQRGGNLSGGQRQRLAVARALLRRPALLLLDDCTSALDAATEAELLAAIGRLPCTILFATQKIAAARRADAIVLLDRDGGDASGRHEDLLRDSEAYRRIVRSQADAMARPARA
nr:ABC transporter ATP-binding protein [Luteimonas sp. Y-2-2-4F]